VSYSPFYVIDGIRYCGVASGDVVELASDTRGDVVEKGSPTMMSVVLVVALPDPDVVAWWMDDGGNPQIRKFKAGELLIVDTSSW
jgi:hypothetical protein